MSNATQTLFGRIGSRIREQGVRRIAFYAVVTAFIGLFGMMAAPSLQYLVTGWFASTELGAHRIHELVIAVTLLGMLLGIVAQLRRPESTVGGIYQTVLIVLSVFVGGAVAGYLRPPVLIFLVWALVAAGLHPAGREILRVRTPGKENRWLLALVIVAAVPLLLFAANQVALQAGTADLGGHDHTGDAHGEGAHDGATQDGKTHEEIHQEHVDEGHFASVAGLLFAIIGLGLLAGLKPDGWWIPAWTAGGMAVVFGLASLLYPDLASSVGILGGSLAICWGIVFIAVAELTQDEEMSTPLGKLTAGQPTGGTGE